MVHKDPDEKREYDRKYKKEMRAAAKRAVPAVQIVINQQKIHVPSAAQSGEDIKDQMLEFLMKENRELKLEIKRLRGNNAEPIYAEPQTMPLALIDTVAVITPETKYAILSEYLNVNSSDSWNLIEFMTNMTIEESDLFPIFKASMKEQILMRDFGGINNVIESILKRELKANTYAMPIRRTFLKNKYQFSLMSDRTWLNVEKSVLNDAIINFCKKICWRLSQLYRTVKSKSVVNTQYTMMYKNTHQFNIEHMPLWFNLELWEHNKGKCDYIGAMELYKHIVESIEELITVTLN